MEERDNCAPFLNQEIKLLEKDLTSILALGSFAWKSAITALIENGYEIPKPTPKFGHGSEFVARKAEKVMRVVGSFHPSQQNTFTGKLTEKMLRDVINHAFKGRKK